MHTEKIVVVARIYLLQHRAKAIKKDQIQQTGLLSAASTLEASTSCG